MKSLLRLTIFFFSVIIFLPSCEFQEEKFTSDSGAKLTFSADTVFFDTVFTSVGSITKRFKVYNPNKNAVNISKISIGKVNTSFFSLIINGLEVNETDNIPLLGGDSLFVLAKVNIDPMNQNLPFIVKDSVTFETNGNFQDVKLIAWGQDANFFRDSVIDCNSTWTADRPYVIFDDVLVDTLCTLTIEKGTQIYLSSGSDFFVRGTLNVLGEPDDRVSFQSVRQDGSFENALGQWGGIVFLNGSGNNLIEGAEIKNGTFGIFADPAETKQIDITVRETIIQNMAFSGISCFGAKLTMENSLISNCLERTVFCVAGGDYTFEHNTFANYSFSFFRENPQLVFGNFVILENADGTDRLIASDLNVTMTNNIVWGSLREEVDLPAPDPSFGATYLFQSNIFRSELSVLANNGNLINMDPKFLDPFEADFALDTLSPAKDAGLVLPINTDILGAMRDASPDIGAYERKE